MKGVEESGEEEFEEFGHDSFEPGSLKALFRRNTLSKGNGNELFSASNSLSLKGNKNGEI